MFTPDMLLPPDARSPMAADAAAAAAAEEIFEQEVPAITNSYSAQQLEQLKASIESMNQHHQIGCLRILDYKQVQVNENKYGTHVNMTGLSDEVLQVLEKYVEYVETQEATINEVEAQKATYLQTFFSDKSDITVAQPQQPRQKN